MTDPTRPGYGNRRSSWRNRYQTPTTSDSNWSPLSPQGGDQNLGFVPAETPDVDHRSGFSRSFSVVSAVSALSSQAGSVRRGSAGAGHGGVTGIGARLGGPWQPIESEPDDIGMAGVDLGTHSSEHHHDENLSTSKSGDPAPAQDASTSATALHGTAGSDVSADTTRSSTSRRPKPMPFQIEDPSYESPPLTSARSPFSPFRARHTHNESRTKLLAATPTEGIRTPNTPPAYASLLPANHIRKAWWRWRPAWIMYIFLLFGFACAVGHHIFYHALAGRPADNQITMLRYGTVLAFSAKAGLAAAVITAYKQRVWMTVREQLLSVAALDSLFAATEDAGALLNFEVYKAATGTMLLAVFLWIAPLSIILTSNTLTVQPKWTWDENTTCPGIRTLNFTKEETYDWRNQLKIDRLFSLSVNLWNKTAVDPNAPDYFDYYTGPSPSFAQVTDLGVYSQGVQPQQNGSTDICGAGWNCTYIINFTGPGYKCDMVASGVGSIPKNYSGNSPPFGTDYLLPEGNFSYYAHATGGDYSLQQLKEVNIGGMPKTGPPFPKELGAFRHEPIVWVGYSVMTKPDQIPPDNRTVDGWDEAFIPKMFACQNYETEYTVNFTLKGGKQIANVTRRHFLQPLMDTTFDPNVKASLIDGTNDNTTAYPKSEYVYPSPDIEKYRRMASYHSVGYVFRDFVNGTMDSSSANHPVQNTKAITSKLINPRAEYFPFADLYPDRIQSFWDDILLSMFANPQLLVLVWAADPNTVSGAVTGERGPRYPCSRTRWENQYAYQVRDLWIVYAIALVGAIAAVIMGTIAVLENEGQLRNTRFSSIVAATRGPALEKVIWKGEDRGHLPPDVKNLKVGYGRLSRVPEGGIMRAQKIAMMSPRDEEQTPGTATHPEGPPWESAAIRYGFGLEGDVKQMKGDSSLLQDGRKRTSRLTGI